jgi:hypothetical protein
MDKVQKHNSFNTRHWLESSLLWTFQIFHCGIEVTAIPALYAEGSKFKSQPEGCANWSFLWSFQVLDKFWNSILK